MHIRDSLARGLGLATLATLVAAGAPTAANEPPALSEARYRAHVERLSSDEFGGRAPGTPGEQRTIAYLEQQFRAVRDASRAGRP